MWTHLPRNLAAGCLHCDTSQNPSSPYLLPELSVLAPRCQPPTPSAPLLSETPLDLPSLFAILQPCLSEQCPPNPHRSQCPTNSSQRARPLCSTNTQHLEGPKLVWCPWVPATPAAARFTWPPLPPSLPHPPEGACPESTRHSTLQSWHDMRQPVITGPTGAQP